MVSAGEDEGAGVWDGGMGVEGVEDELLEVGHIGVLGEMGTEREPGSGRRSDLVMGCVS